MEAGNYSGFQLLFDAATQLEGENFLHDPGQDHQYAKPGEPSTGRTGSCVGINSSISSVGSETLSAFSINPERSGSFINDVGSCSTKRLAFSDISNTTNVPFSMPWTKPNQGKGSSPRSSIPVHIGADGHSSVKRRASEKGYSSKYGVSSSSELQLPAFTDRSKARASPHPFEFKRVGSTSSDHSSTFLRLDDSDPLQLTATPDRSQPRASPHPLPSTKKFKRVASTSSDRSAHSSAFQGLGDSDPLRQTAPHDRSKPRASPHPLPSTKEFKRVANTSSERSAHSSEFQRLDDSDPLQLTATPDRSKPRASPHPLPSTKGFERVASTSSNRSVHSSAFQRLDDSGPIRYVKHSSAFSDISDNPFKFLASSSSTQLSASADRPEPRTSSHPLPSTKGFERVANTSSDRSAHSSEFQRLDDSGPMRLTVSADRTKARAAPYSLPSTKECKRVASTSSDRSAHSSAFQRLDDSGPMRLTVSADRSKARAAPYSLPSTKGFERVANTSSDRSAHSSEFQRLDDSGPMRLTVSADRTKARAAPYSLPSTKECKRVASTSSDRSAHSSAFQRLDDSGPMRLTVSADRSKARAAPYSLPSTKGFERVANTSSDRSAHSSEFQRLDDSGPMRLTVSADRTKARAAPYSLPSTKECKRVASTSSDRSAHSSAFQRLDDSGPMRLTVSADRSKARAAPYSLPSTKECKRVASTSSDRSAHSSAFQRLDDSGPMRLTVSADRTKARAAPYSLPSTKECKRVASTSSDRSAHSSAFQRLDDSDRMRYDVPMRRSFAFSDVSRNVHNASRSTHQDSVISYPSFDTSIFRAITSTPLMRRPEESYHKAYAGETPLDLSLPRTSAESSTPIDLALSPNQNSTHSSCRPMDLRVEHHSDTLTNACDDVENQYDDDIFEIDEEDAEGDPALLNDFSIFECFEEYRNMHTDDEEFPDSDDDEYDFQQNRRCQQSNSKVVTVQGAHSNLIERHESELEDNENETINTTHHNLEKELDEPKTKKKSLRKENKALKLKGMSYTRPDGTVVPARSVKEACNCRMKCAGKYSDDVRKQLLRNLLNLKLSGQNQFIANHMVVTKTARPQVVNSRRTFSRTYRLPGVNGMVKVCKIMFIGTFDITDRKVRNLAAKKIAGCGISEDDQRAFNTSHKTVSQDHLDYIKKHIHSFPAYSSHYSREGSEKRYLSTDLNIKTMYELYQEKCCRENSWIPVHYDTYRIIFNQQNLAFRKPKVDVCGECEKFRIAIKGDMASSEKIALTAAHEEHQRSAQRVYEQKRKDRKKTKEDAAYRTVSFDLQKQLPTPYLRCGQAFYARQLYTYNLTFFSSHLNNNTATCMLWDETKARRGSQEVASCLLRDLKKMPLTVRHVNYYSDRCVGQNLNKTVVFTFGYYVELAAREGREIIVEHKLMRTGHSHMEVDTVHSAIEKAKKKTSIDIEIPHDWVVLISAIRRSIPFEVDEMEQRDFIALKDLAARYSIPKKNDDGEIIRFIDIMVFRYSTNSPGVVFYKYDVGDVEFKEMKITSGIEIDKMKLKTIEDEPIALPDAKLKDLKGLLPFVKNKDYYQTFLKSLVPSKRGRKPKSNKVDHFENDMDLPETEAHIGSDNV